MLVAILQQGLEGLKVLAANLQQGYEILKILVTILQHNRGMKS